MLEPRTENQEPRITREVLNRVIHDSDFGGWFGSGKPASKPPLTRQLQSGRPLEPARRFSILNSESFILLVLLLALSLRLLLWLQPLHQPANDESEYIAVARD